MKTYVYLWEFVLEWEIFRNTSRIYNTFPWQQWLCECTSLLRCSYVACMLLTYIVCVTEPGQPACNIEEPAEGGVHPIAGAGG